MHSAHLFINWRVQLKFMHQELVPIHYKLPQLSTWIHFLQREIPFVHCTVQYTDSLLLKTHFRQKQGIWQLRSSRIGSNKNFYYDGWEWIRSSRERMISSREWMRSSRVWLEI
jgi:hypothetical protein